MLEEQEAWQAPWLWDGSWRERGEEKLTSALIFERSNCVRELRSGKMNNSRLQILGRPPAPCCGSLLMQWRTRRAAAALYATEQMQFLQWWWSHHSLEKKNRTFLKRIALAFTSSSCSSKHKKKKKMSKPCTHIKLPHKTNDGRRERQQKKKRSANCWPWCVRYCNSRPSRSKKRPYASLPNPSQQGKHSLSLPLSPSQYLAWAMCSWMQEVLHLFMKRVCLLLF